MNSNQELMDLAQMVLNYSDQEMQAVTSNPKYRQVLAKAPQLLNTALVFEVDEAKFVPRAQLPTSQVQVAMLAVGPGHKLPIVGGIVLTQVVGFGVGKPYRGDKVRKD